MPVDIIETPTLGTPLSVPIGTDKRKAASLMAAWQAIGDRLKFVENFYKQLVGLDTELLLIDDTVIDVPAGKKLTLGGSGAVLLDAIDVIVDQNVRGALFDAGASNTGRANDRPDVIAPSVVGGTTQLDPTLHNEVFVDATVSCIVQVTATPSVAYVKGDRITIHGVASHNITVKDPAGAAVVTLTAAANYVELIHVGSGVWRLGKYLV